jgi:hydrogenase maturation protein HypF
VYRLALRHDLLGYVQNQLGEVEIVAVGSGASLDRFQKDLIDHAPPLSRPRITKIESTAVPACESFEIAASSAQADAQVFVPPDYFMCDDC